MVLIDSCVWIDFFQGGNTPAVDWLMEHERDSIPEICISGIIYFEILRGVSDSKTRNKIAQNLKKLERRDFLHTSYDQMLNHDWACRKKGVTLSKLGDWLIIQTALDHNLEILSSDKDFQKIQPYVPIGLIAL